MSLSRIKHGLRKQFKNLYIPQVTRNMELRSEKMLRDGVRNDYPDYLIKTVSDSPYAIAAMRKLQSFVAGRGINAEDVRNLMVNEMETFEEFHKKVSDDYTFSGRFAIRIVPDRGRNILQLYHIPFEAVRWGIPDKETGLIKYVSVNYKFNTSDYRPSDTKHYPIFKPKKGLATVADDIRQFEADFPDRDYTGHVLFFCETSEKNRVYSRPAYFAAQDWMKVDAKIGAFHERNTDNNFFLGGILSVVGDPDEQILDEDGDVYTTVGQEFQKQLGATFSGSDNAGRFMIDWVQNGDDATTVQPWPGATHHELFTILENITQERIAVSMGLPRILLGVPTAGKLGDNQEIRNAIKFTNETTEAKRRKLEQCYEVLIDLMQNVSLPEDGLKIERIKDFTDLPGEILSLLTPVQQQQYLLDVFGIEPDNTPQPLPEIPEPEITEEDDTTD